MDKLDLVLLEKLGHLTKEIRKEVSTMPKVGVSINSIIDYIEKRIFDEGYLPAFPATVSINDIAAHYTVFDEEIILKKGDLIKIDFGISYEGFITDNACTVEVDSNNHEDLMKANFAGLNAAMEKVNLGVSMGEVGEVVEKEAEKGGFSVIENLTGHQIANNNLHCGLSVPNYNNGNKSKVEDNMELAIEPFFTYGVPRVKNVGGGNILHLKNYKPVRDVIAKKVLAYIKEYYPILPFSKRWLVGEIVKNIRSGDAVDKVFDKRKVLYALRILKREGIVYEYDALATEDGALVSQFEDTVVFVSGKKSIITRK